MEHHHENLAQSTNRQFEGTLINWEIFRMAFNNAFEYLKHGCIMHHYTHLS